jgi:hypothetical protein
MTLGLSPLLVANCDATLNVQEIGVDFVQYSSDVIQD